MGIVQRQGFTNTIISYFGIFIGYLNVAFLFPKFFSPEHLGLRSVLFEFSLIFAQLSALGFTGITNKYFPYFQSKGKKEKGFLTFILLIPTFGFLCLSILLYLFRDVLFTSYEDKTPLIADYYFLIFPIAFFIILSSVLEIYAAFFNPLAGNFFRDVFLRILTTILIFLYVVEMISLHQFWILFAGSFALSFLGLVIYLISIGQFNLSLNFNFLSNKLFREIINFGLFGLLTNAASMIVLKIDIIMIVYILKDLTSTGIYALAIYIASVIEIPKRALVQITNPILSKAFKSNDYSLIEELYHKTAINQMVIGGFIFLAIWTNIDDLFSLVPNGEVYVAGKYVVLFLGLAKIIDMGTGINGEIISYSKHYKVSFVFVFLLAITGIILNSIFIPIYGIMGAAFATTLAYFIFNVLKFLFLLFKMKLQPFSKNYLIAFVIGGLSFAVLSLVNFEAPVILRILLKGILLLILFIIPVLFLKLSPDLNQLLFRALRKKP